MVAIHPFCALRYNPALIPNLGEVLAPPYDVISHEEQEQLYTASPYNVVRLILGKQYPADTEADSRYTRSQRDFKAWSNARVLARDPVPAIYLIEHTFHTEQGRFARLGFIALLQLEDTPTRSVHRHESTLQAPKTDRTKLLDAVPANLEPIFCVYPDEGGSVQSFLKKLCQSSPITQATLKGDEVRVWAITEPDALQALAHHLKPVSVLIADGHHRYEVAYAHRHQYGALMAYFVSMAEPALVVRAIHRVVAAESANALAMLRTLCVVSPANDLPSLLQWLERDESSGHFGYYDGKALYALTLKPDRLAQWLLTPPLPMPIALLDVSILHGFVLPSLGMRDAEVRYTAAGSEAIALADRNRGSAWLLRALPLQQIYALAAQGLMLPPKSTYFYPKVFSGLAINPLIENPIS
jgi:uncharacterized protein (DUF1015 family)